MQEKTAGLGLATRKNCNSIQYTHKESDFSYFRHKSSIHEKLNHAFCLEGENSLNFI